MKAFKAAEDCPVCQGSGGYSYDETHSTTCKLCCPHDIWYVQGASHPHPGEITCSACGYEARHEPWTRYSPEFEPEAGAKYRILWVKRLVPAPFMPPPKKPEIVRENKAVFGRKSRAGRIAIIDVEGRKWGAKTAHWEVDPAAVVAVMREIN